MRIQWARPFQATPAFLRNYERQAFSFYSTESLENATSNASTYPMPKLKPCVNVVEAKETTTSSSSCSAADTIRHYYVPRYPPLYNFPVYLTKKAGGRRTLTLIKKIEGSCPKLFDDLKKHLGAETSIAIRSDLGQLWVNGDHVAAITEFLESRGF